MDHLKPKFTWWNNFSGDDGQTWYGITYKDNSRLNWTTRDGLVVAKQEAEKMAAEYGIEVVQIEKNPVPPPVVCAPAAEPEPEPEPGPLEFDDTVVAIPTMGGILADLPLSGESQRRFPDEVCLPVTKMAVKNQRDWVVVEYEGRGVAMTSDEAKRLGLVEAENWLPNLKGVSCVPDIGEIASFLRARAASGAKP